MKVHFIIHESFESPAAYEWWAKDRGHEISRTGIFNGDSLPENAGGFDFLIIMGGPQSPATTLAECSYFDAKKEVLLIRDAYDRQKLVLGSCLGAQLIGEALGARFHRSPNREIGVFPIELTEEGRDDVLLKHFPEKLTVGHWHQDMPGLSEGSKVLAYSEGCPRQIVCFNERTYGFQSHMEFTQSTVARLIERCQSIFDQPVLPPYIQEVESILAYNYDAMNQILFEFLDKFTLRAVR